MQPANAPFPSLAPTHVVSTVCAASLIVLMLALDLPTFRFLVGIPMMNIAYNTYFLVRLSQRSSDFHRNRQALDGKEAWPRTAVFPGKLERQCYVAGAFIIASLYYTFESDIIAVSFLTKMVEEDMTAVASRFLYWGQFITSVNVVMQAFTLIRTEDQVMCAGGHAWICTRCNAEESDEPRSLTSRRRPRVGVVLFTSTALTISLAFLTYVQLWTADPGVFFMVIRVFVFVAIHHAYFGGLLHKTRRLRHAGEAWPLTPIYPIRGDRMLYPVGILALCLCCVAMAALVAATLWEQGSFTDNNVMAVATIGIWILEVVILGTGGVEAMRCYHIENEALCEREGHSWKCSRTCSATQGGYVADSSLKV
jgi:hypothetical protein